MSPCLAIYLPEDKWKLLINDTKRNTMGNRKIKIAYCVSGLAGGVCNVIANYMKYMPDDYIVDIITQNITSEKYREMYEKLGFNIILVPSKSESIFRNMHTLYELMKAQKYDIVHAHMTLTNCFPLFVASLCGIKIRVSHSHMAGKVTIKSELLSFLSRKMATDYFACGKEAGKYLYGNHEFKILNNAIELDKYYPNDEVRKCQRKKLGISEEITVIGHVGRFTYQKNHEKIIDIFEQYNKNNPNSVLLLVGGGEKYQEITKMVSERGLGEKVLFTGIINDVYNVIQAMDLFLLPSFYEGLCLAAVEIQACGIPCLFSDRVACETKINDNVDFFSLNDSDDVINKKLNKLLEMGRLINKTGFVQRGFDIQVEANKLDDFYKRRIKDEYMERT